jgi:hypothetical protein
MPWKTLLDLLRGNAAENYKVITEGFKSLLDAQKEEARLRKEEAEQRRIENVALMAKLSAFEKNEAECHRMLIQANANLLKNRERLLFIENVFIKLVKEKGVEVDLPPPD